MATYSKNGYREAVLFIFFKNHQILVEHRPQKSGFEIFIPNGNIEEEDLSGEENYRIVAMKREINEEFDNNIQLNQYYSLGSYIARKPNIKFYGYLIVDWVGHIPRYTIEENRRFAKLEWKPIVEYKEYFEIDTAVVFVKRALHALKDKKLLGSE